MAHLISAILIMGVLSYSCTNRGNNNNNNNNNNNGNNNNSPIGWVLVGNANISGNEAAFPILRFYDHIPYIAFIDRPSTFKVPKVMKYDSVTRTWVNVSVVGDFASGSDYISFDIDQTTGDLYLAYDDADESGKLTVKKYDGSAWAPVGGSSGISTGTIQTPSVILKSDVPYVAYYDTTDTSVKTVKFSGGTWNFLTNASAVPVSSISTTTDGTDLYVAYIVTSTNNIVIKKYDSSDVISTLPAASTAQLVNISIFIQSATLYLTYTDLDDSNNGVARVYDGAWSNLACNSTTGVFSDGGAEVPSLYVHNNGVIPHDVVYVAYSDSSTSSKATVKACLNDTTPGATTWSDIGGLGFTSSSVTATSIFLDNPNPYIAYINSSTGGIDVRKY